VQACLGRVSGSLSPEEQEAVRQAQRRRKLEKKQAMQSWRELQAVLQWEELEARKARADVGLPATATDAQLAQRNAEIKARADVGLPATATDAQLEQRKAVIKRQARAEVGLPATATDAQLEQRKAEIKARADVGLPATASDAELAQRKAELEAKSKHAQARRENMKSEHAKQPGAVIWVNAKGDAASSRRQQLDDLHAKLNAGGRVSLDDLPWAVLWRLPDLIDKTTLHHWQAIKQIGRAYVEQLKKDKQLAQATKKPEEDDARHLRLRCQFVGNDHPPTFVVVVRHQSNWLQAKASITISLKTVAEKWFDEARSPQEWRSRWYKGYLPIEDIRWLDDTKQGALQDCQNDESWRALKQYCNTHNDSVEVHLKKYHVGIDPAVLEATIANYKYLIPELLRAALQASMASTARKAAEAQQVVPLGRHQHVLNAIAEKEAAARQAAEEAAARKAAEEAAARQAAEEAAARPPLPGLVDPQCPPKPPWYLALDEL